MHVLDALQSLGAFLNPDRVIALLTLGVASFGVWLTKQAPTRKDMLRREILNTKAGRVSMSIEGRNPFNEPLAVTIVVPDLTVSLTHLDLLDDPGTVYGHSRITQVDGPTYSASIDPSGLQKLSKSNAFRLSGRIRVYMVIEGEEVSREVPVSLSQVQVQMDPHSPKPYIATCWLIHGDV